MLGFKRFSNARRVPAGVDLVQKMVKGAVSSLHQNPIMWSDMLTSVEVLLGLSIIISLDSSIFGSSRLMIIDRKTLQNCKLSAASWLALSRDLSGGFH